MTFLTHYHLEAQSADTFLVNQWWLDPTTAREVLEEMAADQERTTEAVLGILAKSAPEFVKVVRAETQRET